MIICAVNLLQSPPSARQEKLSERDICTQYITPALQRAGWDFATQVREEVKHHRCLSTTQLPADTHKF